MADVTFDLLRHGQCEGGDIFRGHIDVALTEQGYATMSASLAQQKDKPWQQVITSPKQRCHHFAHDTAQQLQIPIQIENDLREIHFGEWEGQNIMRIWETQQTLMEKWSEDPSKTDIPEGEAFEDFSRRVKTTIHQLSQQFFDKHLLIVTHGGVIRLLLAIAQSMPASQLRSFDVPYGCFVRLHWSTENGLKLAKLITSK